MAELSPGLPERASCPRSVLFMCGQNVVRSPMALAIARARLPADVFVASCGVRAGEADPFVDAVLGEIGLSLGQHRPQTLEDLEDSYFELIVTLAPEAHHTALELTRTYALEVEYWPTADPSAIAGTRTQILDGYRDVRDRLEARIKARFRCAGS